MFLDIVKNDEKGCADGVSRWEVFVFGQWQLAEGIQNISGLRAGDEFGMLKRILVDKCSMYSKEYIVVSR